MSAVQKMEAPAQQIATTRPATPMEMLSTAIERGMAPETLDKFMQMAERWKAAAERMAFNASIAAAKSEIPVISKTATGHNSKKYADFAAYARVVDPILGKHGLGYRFRTAQDEKTIRTTCVLFHKDGHFEENTLSGPADQTGNKNAIQAIGSTLTYLQRYSLVQALGLAAAEDDDGKAGGVRNVITDDQADQLRDVLAAIDDKSAEARFLKWLKVERVSDIPATRFDEALAALRKAAQS